MRFGDAKDEVLVVLLIRGGFQSLTFPITRLVCQARADAVLKAKIEGGSLTFDMVAGSVGSRMLMSGRAMNE